MRKEDIKYTPPKLEYLSKKALQNDDIEALQDTDLLDNVNKFSYKNSGGRKKSHKKRNNRKTKKNKVKKHKRI